MRTKDFVSKHLDVHTRSGDEWQCLCPYHNDTTPSFSINVKLGVFICFACGVKGTMDHLSEHLGVSGPTVIKDEGQEIERLRSAIDDLNKKARYLSTNYLDRFRNDHPYWEHERGLSPTVQQQFELGYDPVRDHGVIPIRDYRGTLSWYRQASVRQRRIASVSVPTGVQDQPAPLWGTSGPHPWSHRNSGRVTGLCGVLGCWHPGSSPTWFQDVNTPVRPTHKDWG